MIWDLHFIRPWWFLMLIPLLAYARFLAQKSPKIQGWGAVCDPHLLAYLIKSQTSVKNSYSRFFLLLSCFFMMLCLSGPSWHQLPVPTYKPAQPRVFVLDMSTNMLNKDLTPTRLERAKFKLHDLLERKDVGQFGLLVFTGEPFVVSPLTDDGRTITALLSSLTPEIMPVGGENLDSALLEAAKLIKQAGYSHGQILVLTADTPSAEAIDEAKKLTTSGIFTSIMPVRADKNLNPLFQRFANSGGGQLVPYTADSTDLDHWINITNKQEFVQNIADQVPLWRDEGRWFLLPALLLLLPAFQRGWLQRMVA
jgi:Ca-activated chloride channel family protein